ncbi:hypothetical protein RND71_018976 [Anisodus tanguticus]|uniref:Uncharacterized protein n=1 Tax=Anisodus tanguticus TaxID=243964 RepID=A0AAE1S570_9SOLA|nr:hypothetical protein RND71_018976 [Anisodus tanguticus]
MSSWSWNTEKVDEKLQMLEQVKGQIKDQTEKSRQHDTQEGEDLRKQNYEAAIAANETGDEVEDGEIIDDDIGMELHYNSRKRKSHMVNANYIDELDSKPHKVKVSRSERTTMTTTMQVFKENLGRGIGSQRDMLTSHLEEDGDPKAFLRMMHMNWKTKDIQVN